MSTTLCSIDSAKLLYCLLSGRPFHHVSCGHISLGQWSLCVLDRKLTLYKIYFLLKVVNAYIERIRPYFDCHICLNSASSKYGKTDQSMFEGGSRIVRHSQIQLICPIMVNSIGQPHLGMLTTSLLSGQLLLYIPASNSSCLTMCCGENYMFP